MNGKTTLRLKRVGKSKSNNDTTLSQNIWLFYDTASLLDRCKHVEGSRVGAVCFALRRPLIVCNLVA